MMQAVISRASSTGAGRAATASRPDAAAAETVTTRLSAEFAGLSRETVERCVVHTWMCAQHLGLPVTSALVEVIAREHLFGVEKSAPPSRRA
jgi:hypothetical protein